MKSIIIATSVHPDFDKRIWSQSKGLSRAGCDVHLVCPWNVRDGEILQGVRFHTFAQASGAFDRLFRLPTRMKTKIEPLINSSSVLHVHDPDLLPLATKFKNRLALVYDCHEYFSIQVRRRAYVPKILRPLAAFAVDVLEKMLARKVGNVVGAAPGIVDKFERVKIPSILIGNEASRDILDTVVHDWKERDPAIVFIGSQHNENGSFLFLKISEALKKYYPHLKFIASDRFRSAKYREIYIATAKKYGVYENLYLHPNVVPHEIMKILNMGTVALHPNLRTEGQILANPTKMYEFMAAGLPVVCSDLPMQKTLVRQCHSGLLAQPEDITSFVNKIREFLDDDDLRLSMGLNAQRCFRDRYCYESRIPPLIKFYEGAIERLLKT